MADGPLIYSMARWRVKRYRRDALDDFVFTIVAFAAAYIGGALFCYAIAHPDLTSVQVLYNWTDALTWNW